MTVFQLIGFILFIAFSVVFMAALFFVTAHIAWIYDRFIEKNPEAPTFIEYWKQL